MLHEKLLIHVLLQTLTQFLTSGKCWPVGQIGTRSSKTVVGITATTKLWIQGMDHDQYKPATPFDTLLVPLHVLLQSLWLDSSPVQRFITSGKCWPLGQIGRTSNSKTVVGIALTTKLWIQDMDYDQYRPATPFDTKLVPIHVLLSHFGGLIPHLWWNKTTQRLRVTFLLSKGGL
jgi:hypothetical protein